MKHVLVIAYYFPPMGLSGVQRITKFVKYLPRNGWSPTVLTVEPGGYFAFDPSLLTDLDHPDIRIVRTASLDPTRFFSRKSTVSLPRESSRKCFSSLSQFVFIPDNKIGWWGPAVKAAYRLHQQRPFDCILATAPPYTAALIARRVSNRCGVPFVVDFRDDWLGNPRHRYATPLHKKAHRHLEAGVFNDARSIVTINRQIANAMKGRHPHKASAIHILNQGYDPADFTASVPRENASSATFTLLYSGVFYDRQTPDFFLQALAAFLRANPEARNHVRADFAGLIPEASKKRIQSLGLSAIVRYKGYLSHQDVVRELIRADVLWMNVGSGPGQASISTSKLFEYLGTRKPVLGLVPAGAARDVLETYDAGFVVYPENVEEITAQIGRLYQLWQQERLPRASENAVAPFDRTVLTAQLSARLDAASS